MKDYAGAHKAVTLWQCHEAVEKELRSNVRLFITTNYRRVLRGNFRMVFQSVVSLYKS